MRYEYDLPQEGRSPAPMQRVDASVPDNFAPKQLQTQGEATMKAADTAMRIQGMYAEAGAKEDDNELFKHIQEVDFKYRQLNNKAAVEGLPGVKESVEKKIEEIEGRIKDPIRRSLFSSIAKSRMKDFSTSAQTYALGNLKHWKLEESDKRIGLARSNAYNQWAYALDKNSPAFSDAVKSYDARIQESAAVRGIPQNSEVYKAYRIDEMTKLHRDVIGAMVSNHRAKDAEEYYKQYVNDIHVDIRTNIEKVISGAGSEQKGIDLAMGMIKRLPTEDFAALIEEGHKTLGADTDAFKIFQAQLSSEREIMNRTRKDTMDRLSVPILQRIMDVEKTGRKLSPVELGGMPEFVAMKLSSDPEVVKEASRISDSVYREYIAEARFNKSMAAGSKAQYDASKKEAQRLAWYDLFSDPDKVAHMSKAEVLMTARQLGTYGDDLIKMHEKSTSKEALAQLKVDAGTFKAMMVELKIPKSEQAVVQEKVRNFVVSQQQQGGVKFDQDDVRKNIALAVSEVYVNERTTPLGISGLSWTGTTKKRRYEVGNPEAIVIPEDRVPAVVDTLKRFGLRDTPKARQEMYDALVRERRFGNRTRGY